MPYLRRPQKVRNNTLLVRKGFQVGVVLVRGFRHMVGALLVPLGQKFRVVSGISMDKRIASKLYRVIHETNIMPEQAGG
jgi:hypothetical protein